MGDIHSQILRTWLRYVNDILYTLSVCSIPLYIYRSLSATQFSVCASVSSDHMRLTEAATADFSLCVPANQSGSHITDYGHPQSRSGSYILNMHSRYTAACILCHTFGVDS